MTPATANGRPDRKQLSDQLDRRDRVIDLLATNLNEAVADACREGARLAVRDAVLELLTNPDLRVVVAGLAPAAPPPPTETTPEARAGRWPHLRERVREAVAPAVTRVAAAAAAVVGTARLLTAVMPVRRFLAVGAGVGVAVGLVSYLCPHAVSAAASGVGGAGVAVAAQVGRWLRRPAAPSGTPDAR
jgi:hypothetical protein